MQEVAKDTPMTMRVNNGSGRAYSPRAYGGCFKGDVPPLDMEPAAIGRRAPMGEYMRRYWRPGLLIIDSIAKSIVEAHGGNISYDSLPNGGTAFHFDLPAEDRRGAIQPE